MLGPRTSLALTLCGSCVFGAAIGFQLATPDGTTTGVANESVGIENVRGTDGTNVPLSNTIESVSDEHGSVESIRGIKGIDTVMLQNLEAVLRMQQRPQESQAQGGAHVAASLLTMQPNESEEVEPIEDERQIYVEYEMEGS